jgi:hypothetical protein
VKRGLELKLIVKYFQLRLIKRFLVAYAHIHKIWKKYIKKMGQVGEYMPKKRTRELFAYLRPYRLCTCLWLVALAAAGLRYFWRGSRVQLYTPCFACLGTSRRKDMRQAAGDPQPSCRKSTDKEIKDK